jgi:hypothetical protein
MKNAKVQINLMEDLHGFPTYAVHYRHTRYNFCHLEDVCTFVKKVYNVDNDRLLSAQQPTRINPIVPPPTTKRGQQYAAVDFLIQVVCDKPTIAKEVYNYVQIEFPQIDEKVVHNRLLQLTSKGSLKRAPYNNSKKVCTYVVSR